MGDYKGEYYRGALQGLYRILCTLRSKDRNNRVLGQVPLILQYLDPKTLLFGSLDPYRDVDLGRASFSGCVFCFGGLCFIKASLRSCLRQTDLEKQVICSCGPFGPTAPSISS